ncbi:unnamed protein product [Lactuca virosa]|uniref:Pectinesterase inhibitor domain-containing protein n=1 Tax=Lactuca virosa TaxID=75947 RepID=A0AAU9LFE0_9ASTR|nr:unnamed protein product [Lactuca virosa]
MTIFSVFAILIFSLFLLVSPGVHGLTESEIRSWCSQTPHPDSCEYLFAGKPNLGPIKQKPDFINAILKLTLEKASNAEVNTRSLGGKCRNKHEKAAWQDCLELYETTVHRINMTIDPQRKCSQVERQTWLSTALTNLETCKTGFEEVGSGEYLLPLMNNNLSALISNTLAMNKGGSTQNYEPRYRKGFPTWVKPGDRKLLQSSNPAPNANIVVAQDGSSGYKTIGAAIAAAKSGYVIYVKEGTYNEIVQIGSKLNNIMLVGDGIGKTIISGSKSAGGGATSFSSATFAIVGDGFIGRGITIRNTAGPQNHQAVALRSASDLSVFYQCSFEGYQDTLYVLSNRQFYKESQGRTDPNQNTGISIHDSRVAAASSLSGVKTYLGRPWKEYSRTVYLKTYLDSIVNPAGWYPWSGNFALNTLYYGEYMNTGPGSSTANRVKWKGYHVITSATEASKFDVQNFISGGSWLPPTGVPFTSGL